MQPSEKKKVLQDYLVSREKLRTPRTIHMN